MSEEELESYLEWLAWKEAHDDGENERDVLSLREGRG